jgi:hypothetical protein
MRFIESEKVDFELKEVTIIDYDDILNYGDFINYRLKENEFNGRINSNARLKLKKFQ